MIDLVKSSAEILKNNLSQSIHKQNVQISEAVKVAIKTVNEKGFFVVENFIDPATCSKIRTTVDKTFTDYQKHLWVGPQDSDKRAFGIDRVAPIIKDAFYNNAFIRQTREAYYSLEDQYIIGLTMANKIIPNAANLGSGGGWHRDSVNVKQFKAILYLSDVGDKNGPFQYLEGTQFKKSVLDGIIKHGFKYNHNRFSEEEIAVLIQTGNYPLHTFTAKQGTLLLVDTSGVHRGMPISEGHRYALTNYYWISKKKGGKGMSSKIADLLVG